MHRDAERGAEFPAPLTGRARLLAWIAAGIVGWLVLAAIAFAVYAIVELLT